MKKQYFTEITPNKKSYEFKNNKLYFGGTPVKCTRNLDKYKIYAQRIYAAWYMVRYIVVDLETKQMYKSEEFTESALDLILEWVEDKPKQTKSTNFNPLTGEYVENQKSINPTNGTKENLQYILEQIKDKVIVTGSYAYGTQTSRSDIDFYVKEVPEELVDLEADFVEDTYVRELIRFFESLGYEWSSCTIMSFAVDDTYIPLEFSALYDIDGNLFEIEILGVKMLASKSNHTSGKYLNGQKRSLLL